MTETNIARHVETLTGAAAGSAFWPVAKFYDVTFEFRAQVESSPLASAKLQISDDNGVSWRTAYSEDGRPITAAQADEEVAQSVTLASVPLRTGFKHRFNGTSTVAIDVRLDPADWPTR